MFELDGDILSVEDIQSVADSLNMSYDEAFAKLTQQGLIQPTSTNNMDGNDTGFFQPLKSYAKAFSGFDDADISEEEAKDEIGFLEGASRLYENRPTRWKQVASQMTEWLGSHIEFMAGEQAADFFLSAFDEDHDIDGRKTGLRDTETGEIVTFDREAYKRDGHDAVENKKYYELVKKMQNTPRYVEGERGLQKNIMPAEQVFISGDGSAETIKSNYAKAMADRHKKSLELTAKMSNNKITDSKGFLDAVKNGRVGDVILESANFIQDSGEQLIAGWLTGGASMAAQMGGMSYHDYNVEKAKSIYGEDDPDAFEKLVASGQDEIGVPSAFATVGYVLERAGFKGLTKEIMKKSFGGKKAFSLFLTGNKEGFTEYGQGLTERMNKNIGKGMSFENAIKDVGSYMTTEEAWDQYFAGLIGGTAMSAGGSKINAALRNDPSGSAFINEKINNIAKLGDAKARSTSKRRKKKYEDEIQIQETELKEYLESNKDLSNYLSKNQEDGLNSLVDNIRDARKEAKDLNSLYKKGVITKQQFDAGLLTLNERMSRYNKGIATIKNDANMAKLQRDLDSSGQLVGVMKGLEQEVYKTEEEFLAALKTEILAQGGTEQDYINAIQDKSGNKYTIDGLKVGGKLLINAKVAAERNATATGTHEVLHGLLKATLQEDDGSGNLSKDGEKIVQDFLKTLTRSQRKRLDKKLDEGNYKKNSDGSNKEFKEYGEEYINFYAQLSKQEELDLSKVGQFLSKFFNKNTEFKKISFQTGADTKAFLDAIVADSKEGIYRKEIMEFAEQQDLTGDKTVKASMTAEQRATAENEIKRLGREGLVGDNLREEGIGKVLFDASFEDIYSRIKSEGFLDNLIAAKFKGDVVPRDFVDKVYSELTSHAKNFNPEQNDDFFGYLNSQIANKAGNVYNREYKVDQTAAGRARDIGETTQEGEVKVQVEADTDTALEALETEDLSLAGQAKAQAKRTQRQSKFRKQLGFETGGEMYNRVLQAAKKSVLIAYRKTQSIKDPAKRARAIKDLLRKEYFTKGLTSDLFKSTKNFLGTKDYIKNLKQYREVIIESLSTADLVQMERKVPDNERAFTVFDKKLTKIEDVESAVQRGLLPTEAINAIQKGQAVNLYRKRMPTESELVEFADQPAINPVTGARSGLKGTRKDGFAKAIANTMVLDAVMEVRQSEDVVEALEDDAIAQLDLMALSDAVGREVDIKFSKSTAVADINNAIDNNINLAVYSQIKFSRSHREAYEARLAKKRTDLDEKQIKGAVESIFKFVEGDNILNNKKAKYEKMAMHYMANGYLILPEDGYKVVEAERIATIKKIDPFSYKNPNLLIEKFAGEVKGARTNPDTVEEFTNKTEVGQGVTVYDVADSKEGQLAVRKVIDTHFGKKANPWCLAARDNRIDQEYGEFFDREEAERFADELKERGFVVETFSRESDNSYEVYGDLMAKPGSNTELDAAFKAWKRYNKEGNGFKIAFKNGKLLCFRDGNKKQWWDRNDKPSDKIHFVVTEKKGDVESTFSVVPEDGTKTLTKKIKGKMPNAEVFYVRDDNNYNIKSTTTYVNGAITKQRIETTYKDSRLAGTIFIEKQMGQSSDIQLGNVTKDIQVNDGNILTTELKGKVALTSKQFKQFEDEAVEIEHVTNMRTSETISLTINGVKQNIDVKFSRSASDKLKGVKQLTEKQSKKVLGTILVEQDAIEKRLNTEEELDGDQLALNALIEFQKAIESGTSPLTAYEMIIGKLPEGSNNISFKSAAEFVQTVKDISINKIREQGFKALVKYLEPKLKGKSLKSQKEIIDSFLRNGGRTGRTAKVFGITKNKQIKEQLIDQLLDGKFSEEYTLGPGKFGGEVFEGVELYENIENIKNNVRINNELRGKVNQQAQEARDFMFEILDSNLSLAEKYAIIDLLAIDQRGTIRKMYTMGATVTPKSNLSSKQLTLEHEITASDMVSYLKAYAKNNNKTQAKKVLNEILDQARVHVLPKKIDDALNKAGHKSTGGRGRYAVGTEARGMLQEMYRKGDIDFVPVELTEVKELNILGSAIQFSRSTKNPTKGISILDFDDTLATSKSLVKFTRPDGSKGTLTPEQYASTYEDLSDLGYKFDFSEFSKVVDGKPAPLLNKAKKLAGKFGTKDMFVLTARPADSAPAIREFLKQNGLDIPLKNITGLGNSTAEAKALWVADKVANGYNDFYFADDALKNVQAVQNMLDQFDVKSKVQQARIKFSRTMSDDFNKMLERSKGVPFDEAFSRARALKLGKNKGKFQVFVPPSADDFEGLLYYFVGKGEQGNKDLEFFKQAVIDPFSRAYTELDQSRQTIINDWDNLRKRHSEVANKLGDLMPASEFTFDNAIRVYLYNKAGHDIPGLSEQEVENMVERIKTDKALLAFAENLQVILKLDDVYVKPNEYWTAGSTASDVQEVSEKIRRAEFLSEWIENKNEIFNEANLNKIEATYGSRFRSAFEDVLYRMETGRTRSSGSADAISNKWMRWLNNSVGAIMFINTKSALLQTISMINYVNYVDNNPLQAAKAFANQKQYWADFTMIFNSDFLKQRRKGLKTDVQTAEIASAVANATNKAQAAVAYLLKKGFLPTQMADSFAIAAGGATFYRNRVKTYLNEGLSQKKAEEKAFNDFRNSTEESQQSARPDRISQQQVSNAGRLLLNFQNYPMQQARLFKKALVGLARGTGDKKQHLSRIVFYGFAQNMIFLSLQNALFAMLFDHEDEEEEQKLFDTKMERILNGMVDTMLRGSGIAGGVIATGKNTILKAIQELEKGGRANEANIILEALNLSPAVGSKLRKINKGFRTYKYNKDAIDEMSKLNINNPIWTTAAPIIEGVTNVPTDRSIRLINQVREGFNTDNSVAQRISMLLGFSPYEIGVDPNKEVKEAKKKGKGKSTSDKKQCSAFTGIGVRCRNKTTNESGRCYAHD